MSELSKHYHTLHIFPIFSKLRYLTNYMKKLKATVGPPKATMFPQSLCLH